VNFQGFGITGGFSKEGDGPADNVPLRRQSFGPEGTFKVQGDLLQGASGFGKLKPEGIPKG
jgi:hypothetical protein